MFNGRFSAFRHKISFKRLISIALISELVFIAFHYIKTFWLLYITIPSSKEEVHSFNPLSLHGLMDLSEYGLNGILEELNLFQIAYCLAISYSLYLVVSNLSYLRSLRLTSICWVMGFFFWSVIQVFMNLVLIS